MADIKRTQDQILPPTTRLKWKNIETGVWAPVVWAESRGDSLGGVDAFLRSRVSNPHTVFDAKQIFDDPDLAANVENFPLFFDNAETSGSGTSTAFDVNEAGTTLSVSANTAGTRVRQSKQRFNYQPGKSQQLICTGVIGAGASGVIKRTGLFDDDNGVFFELNGTTVSVVIRSNVTGSAVDTAVAQADWNIDKFDGTGKSGITLDLTNIQVFTFDFEWLGSGTVAFGFFVDRELHYVHLAHHANRQAAIYMSTPNLPARTEIINDGTGAAASIKTNCVALSSEGGVQPGGVIRSGNLGTLSASEISASVINSTYVVCAIRLKTTYLAATVREIGFSMLAAGNVNFMWSLHFNPTVTTSLNAQWADQDQSAIQFAPGQAAGNILTDLGYVIDSGYVSNQVRAETKDLGSALRLGADIDGTRDILVLGVTPTSVNQDILGSLTWREIT